MRVLGPPAHILRDYWGPGAHHMIWLRSLEVGRKENGNC